MMMVPSEINRSIPFEINQPPHHRFDDSNCSDGGSLSGDSLVSDVTFGTYGDDFDKIDASITTKSEFARRVEELGAAKSTLRENEAILREKALAWAKRREKIEQDEERRTREGKGDELNDFFQRLQELKLQNKGSGLGNSFVSSRSKGKMGGLGILPEFYPSGGINVSQHSSGSKQNICWGEGNSLAKHQSCSLLRPNKGQLGSSTKVQLSGSQRGGKGGMDILRPLRSSSTLKQGNGASVMSQSLNTNQNFDWGEQELQNSQRRSSSGNAPVLTRHHSLSMFKPASDKQKQGGKGGLGMLKSFRSSGTFKQGNMTVSQTSNAKQNCSWGEQHELQQEPQPRSGNAPGLTKHHSLSLFRPNNDKQKQGGKGLGLRSLFSSGTLNKQGNNATVKSRQNSNWGEEQQVEGHPGRNCPRRSDSLPVLGHRNPKPMPDAGNQDTHFLDQTQNYRYGATRKAWDLQRPSDRPTSKKSAPSTNHAAASNDADTVNGHIDEIIKLKMLVANQQAKIDTLSTCLSSDKLSSEKEGDNTGASQEDDENERLRTRCEALEQRNRMLALENVELRRERSQRNPTRRPSKAVGNSLTERMESKRNMRRSQSMEMEVNGGGEAKVSMDKAVLSQLLPYC